jgi:hypothetical protein
MDRGGLGIRWAFMAPAKHGLLGHGAVGRRPLFSFLLCRAGPACFPSFGAGGHGFRHFPATPGVENYLSWSINGRGQILLLGVEK